RAFPPTLPACCRSSSPDPETSFPAAHTKATPRESWQTDSDTPTPAPPVPPLPPTRPPDVFPSAATGSPLPPIPQSPPASSSPSHLLTETALPSRILNQPFDALYRRRRAFEHPYDAISNSPVLTLGKVSRWGDRRPSKVA